jgi:hypothetical protein
VSSRIIRLPFACRSRRESSFYHDTIYTEILVGERVFGTSNRAKQQGLIPTETRLGKLLKAVLRLSVRTMDQALTLIGE